MEPWDFKAREVPIKKCFTKFSCKKCFTVNFGPKTRILEASTGYNQKFDYKQRLAKDKHIVLK